MVSSLLHFLSSLVAPARGALLGAFSASLAVAGGLTPPAPTFEPMAARAIKGIDTNGGSTPSDIVTLDFNCDDIPDLAVSYAFSDRIGLFAGRGDGTFELTEMLPLEIHPLEFDDSPRKLIVADLDGDGFDDLVTINSGLGPFSNAPPLMWTNPTVGVFFGLPRGGFEPMRLIEPSSASPGERLFAFCAALEQPLRGERPHLLVGHAASNEIERFRPSRRTRGLESAELYAVETAGIGPYDLHAFRLRKDSHTDLLVVNERDAQVWIESNVPGAYDRRVVIHQGVEMLAGFPSDFDHDGLWDIALIDGGADALVTIWGLDETGGFERKTIHPLPAGSGAVAIEPLDANLDGYTDLAILFRNSDRGRVFLNTRGMNVPIDATSSGFRGDFEILASKLPRALIAFDFNGDQAPDFAVANEGDATGDDADDANPDIVLTPNPIDAAPGLTVVGIESPGGDGDGRFGLALENVSGLTWDATRQIFWTIDRGRRLLVALAPTGAMLEYLPLREIDDQYLDFVDLATDDLGALWLLDRARRRVVGWDFGNTPSRTYPTPDYGIERPESIDWNGQHLMLADEGGRLAWLATDGAPMEQAATVAKDPTWDPLHQTLVGLTNEYRWLSDDLFNTVDPVLPRSQPVAGLAPYLDRNPGIARWLSFGAVPPAIAPSSPAIDFGLLARDGTLGLFRLTRPEIEGKLTWSFDHKHTAELSGFSSIAAMTRLAGGGLLLADSGALGSLVELRNDGELGTAYRLEAGENVGAPAIAGIGATTDTLFVLKATGGTPVHAYAGPRGRGGHLEALAISGSGVPRRGLYYDPVSRVLYLGSLGRIERYRVMRNEAGAQPLFRVNRIADIALPAYMRVGSIGAGPRADTIAVWAPEIATMVIIDVNLPRELANIVRRRALPVGFRASAVLLPDAAGANGWLAGRGDAPLVEFDLERPQSAARQWLGYR